MAVVLVTMIRVELVEHRFLPEVETIHVAVAEVERPLMWLECATSRETRYIVPNGEPPRHDFTRGGPQGHQVGLCHFGIEIVRRERFPIDLDIDLILTARQLDRSTDQSGRENTHGRAELD
jgi:hypothetical protein